MSLVDKFWKWERRIFIALALALSANTISIPVTAYINSKVSTGNKTAVFTSGYCSPSLSGRAVSAVIDFFMYTPVTLRQNLNGSQVDWYSNSARKQVLDVLQNTDYQNIVFIGHGSKSSYVATDGNVSVDDLTNLDLPPRHGEFIQHTCGGGNGKSLREVLYPSGSRGYNFDKEISIFENYRRSLVELGKSFVELMQGYVRGSEEN